MEAGRKLPIGIQDFESIRKEGYLYVDKTQYIHKLFHEGKPYFLSRPRRFGKSLLLSTMRAFFEGKKELFKGLKIEELERDDPDAWQEYPVFYIDFNKKNFRADSALEQVLEAHLTEWEAVYGNENAGAPLEMRFQYLVRKAAETSGKNVVILVDEYDKPLLEGADNEMIEHNKAVFKGFFSTLKSYDRYIKFVFITGVTKFSKVSISSDLNQLNDISLDNACGGICGITEGELKSNFIPEVGALAEAQEISTEECYAKLGKMYDGYHFGNKTEGVYNPFSLLNAFYKKEFGMYLFATGTPTFLIDKLKSSGFDAKQLGSDDYYEEEASLMDYRMESANPVPLFYQTGYLTVKDYDKEFRSYALGYPNEEVKYGFLKSLEVVPRYWTQTNPPYEVDFLIQRENDIFPVEVKAEANTASKSLKKFKELFPDQVKLRVRFSLDNLKLDDDVLNIPLFMSDQADRLIGLALEKKECPDLCYTDFGIS